MRWFKHYSDNHRGQSFNTMFDELGYFGPFFYYLIYEICSEKMQPQIELNKQPDSCKFKIHRRVVCSAARARLTRVEFALNVGQSCGLWEYNLVGEYFEIYIPILLNLLDRDMKKPRQKRGDAAKNTRLDKDIDKDIDKDKDKDKEINTGAKKLVLKKKPDSESDPGSASQTPPVIKDLVVKYCDLWKLRYGTNPPIGGKTAGQLKTLVRDFGFPRAIGLIEAYLKMPDPWFVTKRHDVGTLLLNLNAVAQFLETGKTITRADIKSLEEPKRKSVTELLEEGNKKNALDV